MQISQPVNRIEYDVTYRKQYKRFGIDFYRKPSRSWQTHVFLLGLFDLLRIDFLMKILFSLKKQNNCKFDNSTHNKP